MLSFNSRILVAEDDDTIRMLVVEVLHDAGYSDVMEASDGEEACHLLDCPDGVVLIVTDINMPHASGIDIAKWGKSHHPNVRLLFMSADPGQLRSLPFPYRFLQKPFTIRQLVTAVEETRPSYAA